MKLSSPLLCWIWPMWGNGVREIVAINIIVVFEMSLNYELLH